MPYRLIKRVDGKRGGLLFLIGLWYLVVGAGNIWTPTSRSTDLAFAWLSHGVPYLSLTANTLGWTWVAAGVVCLWASWSHSDRGQGFGFAAAATAPALWGLIFAGSYAFGNPHGFRAAPVYLFISMIMLYVSSWADPASLHHHAESGLFEEKD